jgi:hypothetical protein
MDILAILMILAVFVAFSYEPFFPKRVKGKGISFKLESEQSAKVTAPETFLVSADSPKAFTVHVGGQKYHAQAFSPSRYLVKQLMNPGDWKVTGKSQVNFSVDPIHYVDVTITAGKAAKTSAVLFGLFFAVICLIPFIA